MELPTSLTNEGDEKRPLLRTSSEFKIWQSSVTSIIICYLITYFSIMDIPVYWPFLFCYFISLLMVTYKKHRKHMDKYGYSIFDFTKKWLIISYIGLIYSSIISLFPIPSPILIWSHLLIYNFLFSFIQWLVLVIEFFSQNSSSLHQIPSSMQLRRNYWNPL